MDAGNAPKAKVLIVDDEPPMRLLIRTALESLPVEMAEASDGKEALNLIESQRPDLLVCDYLMPNCDGLTLCFQLQQQTDLKPIKTVLVTGAITPDDLMEALDRKMVDAALTKPVDVLELRQLVKSLLALN